MSLPKTVRDFALKHKISVGRNNYGYYIREHGLVVEQTRSAKPTVANALAMMRRHLRQHRKEGSYVAKNPVGKLKWPHRFAGGTSVPEGKYGHETERLPIGYYSVSPIAWPNGRMRGYLASFVNDKGAVPGGLHQQLGVFSSPNKAKAAAEAHYQGLATVKTNPRRKRMRRGRNPMSVQARKDFARRMARARQEKQARKRIAIKRQIRRSGGQVDANANTKLLRAQRKASAPRGMYQIGALTADKRIAWWGGSGFTLLRGDAVGYGSLAQARVKAKRLEPNLVAGIFRSDVSAERARNFLLGKK